MSKTVTVIDANAAATLTQFRAVRRDGSGNLVHAVVGEVAIGIIQNSPTVGKVGHVLIEGNSLGQVSGVIKAGDFLSPDVGGKLRVAQNGDDIVGQARESGAVDAFISVDVNVAGTYGTVSGGTVTGSGAATQVALWNGATSLTGLANSAGVLTNDGAGVFSWGAGGGSSPTYTYTCPGTVAVNDAVYLSGAGSVDKASNAGAASVPAIGLVTSKPTATTCVVQASGKVSGLVGLTAGAYYYLGAAGAISTAVPTSSGEQVQLIGYAPSTTELWLVEKVEAVERA